MDTTVLNGEVLGSGGEDPRSFITMSTTCRATIPSVTWMEFRYVTAAQDVIVSAAANLTAVFQMAIRGTAAATTSITPNYYFARYMTAAMSAVATTSIAITTRRMVSAAVSVVATLTEGFFYGTTWGSSTYATASAWAAFSRWGMAAASPVVQVSSTARFVVATNGSGAITASVTTSIHDAVTGYPAGSERTMVVPPESRSMKVP